MRTFLGVLMVIIVSGDNETIKGSLDGSVLLQCNCSERNVNEKLQWQKEKPFMLMVFRHNQTNSVFNERYKGRAKTFLSDNSNNCSILLNNITADDQGIYKCSFYIQETYQRSFVNLSVSADYHVCQNDDNPSGSGKVFHCCVKGRYGMTEIQWRLDGQLLTNSTTTYITHTDYLDATGYYYFNSTLSTKLNWTSKPTCDVKAEGVSTNIINDCSTGPSPQQQGSGRYRHLTIIPITLVLGLSLLVWRYRSNTSRSTPRIRDDPYC
ncbi:T-lymphocyte activation antigen CD80-like [Epinephelus fuscoguttatus]|uniref:T-lymphocyte activation antigen CD80-like n=1 Tax=Epinephelus fuscoguttatus TaxID=293821 RepID=UPI0020D0D447|nr:T-lymphocyte activation antigen CD80-like [Epinephelus fuscoguttatus]